MKNVEKLARRHQANLNHEAATAVDPRAELGARYGQLWDTQELQRDFSVEGFGAPCVVVVRKSDGVRGSLFFSHSPRLYHSFSPA